MGKKCALKNCKNYQKEPSYGCAISFHGLPRNKQMSKKWLEAIPEGLIRENATKIYLCSAHFAPESFQPETLCLTKNMLRRTAVPTIFDNVTGETSNTKKLKSNKTVSTVLQPTTDGNKVNFVNISDTCVYVITKTPAVVPQTNTSTVITPNLIVPPLKKLSFDIGVQVSLPTEREKALQRQLYTTQKRLERREARISSIMTDFKTLMDQN